MGTGSETRTRAPLRIGDVAKADLAAVLAINEQSVPAMNSLTMERMEWFADEAKYFRIARLESVVAGFLICLAPEARYPSPNLRWLNERLVDFLYIDRVAVSPACHRHGIATALYRDASRCARNRFKTLACEVNLRPPNEKSVRFHERLGFEAIGSQDHGYVEVQYMIRPLPI